MAPAENGETRNRRGLQVRLVWLLVGVLLGLGARPAAIQTHRLWVYARADSSLRFLKALSTDDVDAIEIQLRFPESYDLTGNGKRTRVILTMPEDRPWIETFLTGLKDLRRDRNPPRPYMGQQIVLRTRSREVRLRILAVSPASLAETHAQEVMDVSDVYKARLVPRLTTAAVLGKLIEEKRLCVPRDP